MIRKNKCKYCGEVKFLNVENFVFNKGIPNLSLCRKCLNADQRKRYAKQKQKTKSEQRSYAKRRMGARTPDIQESDQTLVCRSCMLEKPHTKENWLWLDKENRAEDRICRICLEFREE